MKLMTTTLLIVVAVALLFSAVRHCTARDWNPPERKATCCETTD